ncbi:hypothetical protein F2Q68_00043081 [Brassica cretica]|uniref:glutathione-specific gamma-glutamylcyclotransferase n=2 Tax=Brassica cretica TaxID=69181 RepID=A0A8S9LQT9_BRACR|nr:hypothetical protein F2Q68_00043081 [Brassica cretica]KAF3520745.1 hypothetical protein DY000_02058570 [Brassica cretica]
MAMWVFGYGSLIWKTGFPFDDRLPGFIKNYRRVFHQGSTDHRGTPEFPGRTVTLEPATGEICWGVAYKITKEEDKKDALLHLEVREKQYDQKEYLDFFTDINDSEPAVSGVMVYIASPDKKSNNNYLGPAPFEDIAKQIVKAEGPSGPNRDYLFNLEEALVQLGFKDKHVTDLATHVRLILSATQDAATKDV